MGRKEELRKFLEEYRQEVRESALALLPGTMPALSREDFDLYEKTGNRTVYQSLYFPRREFLAVLGMEAILEWEETGAVEDAVLDKLCDVIAQICEEETWALPAHVTRQNNPDWRNTADLFASETAQTMSELLDRLDAVLPEAIKNTMEEQICRRVLEPYYCADVPYAWWEVGTNNWTAVCAGSIGSACIHLAHAGRHLPRPLPECLARVQNAMPYYFQGFTDDGACMEGLQYYTYGMTYFANFAWELRELTGENLFDRPDIAAFPAKCFFPDGVSLSFSDGSSHDTFRVGLQALQALAYGDAAFPSMTRAAHLHSDSCYRFAGLKMDYFATKLYLEKLSARAEDGTERTAEAQFHILPSAQWCIGSAKDGTGFACKGGHNGESHNHNDIGHLIYEGGGVLFLTDLGAGEYDRDYFSKKRYEAICNHSFGHSVPILCGEGQREGEVFRCTAFSAAVEEKAAASGQDVSAAAMSADATAANATDAAAMSVNAVAVDRTAARVGTVRMELGSAYGRLTDNRPLDGKAVLREICFDLETGEAAVTDRFDLRAGEAATEAASAAQITDEEDTWSVTENLVTQVEPRIEGNRIYLAQNGALCVIEVTGSCVAEADGFRVAGADSSRALGATGSCMAEATGSQPGAAAPVIGVVTHAHRNHQGEAEKVYGIRWEVPLRDGKGSCHFTMRRSAAE